MTEHEAQGQQKKRKARYCVAWLHFDYDYHYVHYQIVPMRLGDPKQPEKCAVLERKDFLNIRTLAKLAAFDRRAWYRCDIDKILGWYPLIAAIEEGPNRSFRFKQCKHFSIGGNL